MCPGKEGQSSTLVQKFWKTTKRKKDTEKKKLSRESHKGLD